MCTSCTLEQHVGVIYGLHIGDYNIRYVGKTNSPRVRYKAHISSAMRGVNYPVHCWIRKYNGQIQMTILETFDDDTIHLINEREIFHIAQSKMYDGSNLNVTAGGDGTAGRPLSAEHRAKISAKLMGKVLSDETKARMRRTMPLEVRAKISEARKGIEFTEETRERISVGGMGNTNASGKRSDEIREKMAHSAHTRWHTNKGITKSGCKYCPVS